MRSRTLLLVPSLFFFVTGAARAGEPATQTPKDEAPNDDATSESHLRGLELTLRPTIGSAGAGSPLVASVDSAKAPGVLRPSASSYGAAVGAGAQIGFRFHPLVSAGLRADVGTVSATPPTDGTSNLSRGWQSAGLYARAYPLALSESVRRWLDPWVASGLVYVHDGQTFDRKASSANGPVDVNWQIDSHSIAVPLAFGVDFRVTKWFSAGPSFEYLLTSPIAGCAKGSAGGQTQRVCTGDGGNESVATNASNAWNFGITLRATPF